MKRILILIAAISLATNALAKGEAFLGAGYDFHRHGSNEKLTGTSSFDGNAKIRAEWLPFEGEKGFKGGFGIAHDFGTKDKNGVKLGQGTPVYAVWKPEWKINDSTKFYNKYRLGWSFNSGKDGTKSGTYAIDSDYKSGPYAGAELGFQFGKVALGITHDMLYIPSKTGGKQYKGTVNHQTGLQVGYVFGGESTPKYVPRPVVVTPTPAPIVEIPPIVEPEPEIEAVPVVEKKVTTGKAVVKFEFDYPNITLPRERAVLDQTIDLLNKAELVDVNISGHTDAKGSDAYNEKLGQARAAHVANEISNRTNREKVRINTVFGEGERRPVATNETDEGRAENRRVEIDFNGYFE